MLDRAARNELLTLSKTNGATVARHLVMAGMLLESDPELAHQHALAAVRGAGRIAVAREALALTSYATGRYVEALKEVRAARRLSGRDEHHVLEADSERGLGRPDRALQVVQRAQANAASDAEFAELAIVASGARADLGENEAGLLLLRTSRLEKIRDVAIRVRLDQVIADRLDEIGRTEEAAELRASLPVVLDEADEPFEVIDLVEDDEDEQEDERPAERAARPAPGETAEAVQEPDGDASSEEDAPTADAELAEEPAAEDGPEAEDDSEPAREAEPEPDAETERSSESDPTSGADLAEEPGAEVDADAEGNSELEPEPEPEDDGHEQLDLFSSLGDPSDEGPASGSTVDR